MHGHPSVVSALTTVGDRPSTHSLSSPKADMNRSTRDPALPKDHVRADATDLRATAISTAVLKTEGRYFGSTFTHAI